MHPSSAATLESELTGKSATRYAPYKVSIDQYREYRRNGFVVIPGLISADDIAELIAHTEDLMQGRLPEQQPDIPEADRLPLPAAHLSPLEKAQFVARIHMLHRKIPLHERYLLHPRVLDVLETLIGPDVLALQTMLFLKPPGSLGQGWHQDTYYIPTHPDTLAGAWIAIDRCDEYNGAMWMAAGSQVEPVYPPVSEGAYGDRHLPGVTKVDHVSDNDDTRNGLSPIADRYPHLLVPANPGDVVFFNGHVLHRSKSNVTADRFRRSFVGHYCNARSFTQWGAGWEPNRADASPKYDPVSMMSNASHILARGDTHLPHALPKFGTPCAASEDPAVRRTNHRFIHSAMGNVATNDMEKKP
ncbi:MAG: Phytanoyl-CoA dioxygenase, partial [Verrucomicrobia bacterium]|nr:Phytanoyl-CoA dioxygenase [Verrucomicrobiota bacterium]